jgi:iron complex transport system substrate-binding protein
VKRLIAFYIILIFFSFLSAQSLSAQTIGSPSPAPRRLISLSPNITEMIYDMGAQDLLIADTQYCKFPPEARTKEKVGGWININFEKIVSLKPDLVLALKFYGKNEAIFKNLNIPTVVLNCDTIEEILNAYDIIGKKIGREKAAKKAKDRLKKALDKIQREAVKQKPLRVLFVIGHTQGSLQQIYGVGPKSFIDELISWAGGVNVLKDSPIPYPIVSKEELLKWDPDVIIDAMPKSEVKPEQFEKETKVWNQLSSLKAVQKGHVYCFNNEEYTVPGPTMLSLAHYLFDTFAEVRAQP